MHMDGLEAMVRNRGDLQGLDSYGIPRRQAAWYVTFMLLVRQYFSDMAIQQSGTCAAVFLEPNLVSSSTSRIMVKTL